MVRNSIAAIGLSSLVAMATMIGLTNHAAAVVMSCPGGSYNASNGSTGVGIYAGCVSEGTTLQIGMLPTPDSMAEINTTNNPDNYEFYTTGGAITITVAIGTDSFGQVNFELDSVSGGTLPAPTVGTAGSGTNGGLIGTDSTDVSGCSVASGCSAVLISNVDLATGYYVVSTYLNSYQDSDPDFQINIADVPEPASLALLGTALVGFGLRRRRKKVV